MPLAILRRVLLAIQTLTPSEKKLRNGPANLVAEFDQTELESCCFGGQESYGSPRPGKDKKTFAANNESQGTPYTRTKIENALMLIYDRVSQVETANSPSRASATFAMVAFLDC